MAQLIRTYMDLHGEHIQFNVITADTLRDAQVHPEKYKNLVVRVAGYSAFYNELAKGNFRTRSLRELKTVCKESLCGRDCDQYPTIQPE